MDIIIIAHFANFLYIYSNYLLQDSSDSPQGRIRKCGYLTA